MAVIGMTLHHERPQAAELARDASAWLSERGHEARLPVRDAGIAGLGSYGCPEETFARGLDLALSIGGDGTMLRTVDLVAQDGVPVVGINVGQLGYLTEIEPAGMRMALKRFLAGSYEIEERMLLAVRVGRCGEWLGEHAALNDAVILKSAMSRIINLSVSVEGHEPSARRPSSSVSTLRSCIACM